MEMISQLGPAREDKLVIQFVKLPANSNDALGAFNASGI
jgi:hypothetical protein